MPAELQTFTFGTDALEQKMRDAILERLGDDRAALKAFEVSVYVPDSLPSSIALAQSQKAFFEVKGALALDDSGVHMKAFGFLMEQGHSEKVDQEIMDDLAFQCYACVCEMKRHRRKNPNARKLVLQ